MHLIRRSLALAHAAWGLLLLAVTSYVVISLLRTLPHLSSGTAWTNLPSFLLVSAMYALPLGVFSVWMLVLARWAWNGHPRLRSALRTTHSLLLILGGLAIWIGVLGMQAAERSAANGGGLMGPLAAIPLVFGVPIVALALASLAYAWRAPLPHEEEST